MSPGLSSLLVGAGSWSNVMLSFTGFGCWRWELRFILTSFGFFLFFFWFISPSFSVDDRYSLLQHRELLGRDGAWSLLGGHLCPPPTSSWFSGLLQDHSIQPSPCSLSHSLSLELQPLLMSNSFANSHCLQASHYFLASHPSLAPVCPTLPFWPPTRLFSLPPASNPLTASQPFLNSTPLQAWHPHFWPDIPFYSWTLLLYPFRNLPSFAPSLPFPSGTAVLFSFSFFLFFFSLACNPAFNLAPYFSLFSCSHLVLAFYIVLASSLLLLSSHPCFGCPSLGLGEGQHCIWAILGSGKHTWEAVDHIF